MSEPHQTADRMKLVKVQEPLSPEQRANQAASSRLGPRQRTATHSKPYWVVPGVDIAFPTLKAARAALLLAVPRPEKEATP